MHLFLFLYDHSVVRCAYVLCESRHVFPGRRPSTFCFVRSRHPLTHALSGSDGHFVGDRPLEPFHSLTGTRFFGGLGLKTCFPQKKNKNDCLLCSCSIGIPCPDGNMMCKAATCSLEEWPRCRRVECLYFSMYFEVLPMCPYIAALAAPHFCAISFCRISLWNRMEIAFDPEQLDH